MRTLLISKCIRMALFATAVNCDLCATPRTVLVAVSLVHKQAVNAELLEGDDVVLGAVQQLLELRLKGLLRLFHGLYAETLTAAAL